MEINTFDVKASHAVTISEPDPEQLLYLQSRGLSPKISRRLVIEGFLSEVVSKMPVQVAERIRAGLREELHVS